MDVPHPGFREARTGLQLVKAASEAETAVPWFDESFPAQEEPAAPIHFKRLDVFLSEYVPLSYVIEPIVRTGSLYSLTAKTGAGKTAWMIAAALAVATGREDILNLDVPRGRVAFLTFENPDDVRMRLKISAFFLNIEVREVAERLLILDMRHAPEAVLAALQGEAKVSPFALIFVDTLAAFFDGDDINSAVQGGNFLRRLRPMTRIPGAPAVVVAAHPVKNAQADQLVPYGSGAILNEVDGNFTLWRKAETGLVEFSWQGKLRGLEFPPAFFRFEITSSPEVLDAKGREVRLPTMLPAKSSEADEEARAEAEISSSIALMKTIKANPKATQRQFADEIKRSKTTVGRLLEALERKGLAANLLGRWDLTAKGDKELQKWS